MSGVWTDMAAWIGAATGILSLGWAVASHFLSGARLVVTANRAIETVTTDSLGRETQKDPHIAVTIANVGRTPVMFRSGIVIPAPTLVQKWRRMYRKPASFVYKSINPYVGLVSEKLMPGDMISGTIPLKELDEYRKAMPENLKVKSFCLLISDSMSQKEKLVKIDESVPLPGVKINIVHGSNNKA